MSLDNAKRYQISRTEDPQLMLPNFVKVSDIILR